jgi:hypothetical protein
MTNFMGTNSTCQQNCMYSQCGFENNLVAKFCNECGQKLEMICLSCGQKNLPGSKFCNECGEPLAKPSIPAPEPASPSYVPRTDFNNPQSYTPKSIAEKILASRSAMEGERKQVTVLFSDVAGFTAMSEHLDPEEVHQIMEGGLNIFPKEIHRYEGTVVNFTGDGVIPLFGTPLAHEDHALRAGLSALNIQKAIGPSPPVIWPWSWEGGPRRWN